MRTSHLLLPTLIAATASAQCALPRASAGPFVGAPFLFSEVDETAAATRVKCAGFGSSTTSAYAATPGRPTLDIGAVLAGMVSGTPPEIDAISFGMDVVVADCSGRAILPSGRWAAVAISVSADANGDGGLITSEVGATGGAAADVFTYVLPGSTLSPFAGAVQRAQDSTEFLAATPNQTDVDALDFHAPLYAMDKRLYDELSGKPLSVYLSVSAASAALVPTAWWGGSCKSGATIFEMKWDWQTSQWKTPVVFLHHDKLGLACSDDVDALALDMSSGQPAVVFSTTDLTRNQLLVAFPGKGAPPESAAIIYSDPGGNPISEGFGLKAADDIDALCIIDPTIKQDPRFWPGPHPLQGLHPIRFAMGWPVNETLFGLPVTLNASAFVTCAKGGKTRYESWGTGWPSGGPAAGWAGLVMELRGGGPFFFGLSPLLPRNVVPVYCGDPQQGGFRLDIGPFTPFRMSDLPVYLHWIAVDSGAGGLVTGRPVLIHL